MNAPKNYHVGRRLNFVVKKGKVCKWEGWRDSAKKGKKDEKYGKLGILYYVN